MNDRIKQLIMEAVNFRLDPDSNAYEAQICPEDLEYLAELIVRECAEICNKIYFNNYPDAEDFERSEEGDAIKKHFGIEE